MSLRASSLSKAVEEIQAQSGLSLSVDPAIRQTVVAIRVKEMPLDSLLNRLAEVVSAEWKHEAGGGRKLVRSVKMQSELDDAYYAGLEREVKALQDEERRRLREDAVALDIYRSRLIEGMKADLRSGMVPDYQADDRAFFPSGTRHPASIVVGQVFTALPASKIVRLEPGWPATFATANNSFQEAMPGRDEEFLGTYNRYAQVVFDLLKESPATFNRESGLGSYYFSELFEGRATKCVVGVQFLTERISCHAQMFDDRGFIAASALKFWFRGKSLPRTDELATKLPSGLMPVNLSDLSKAYIAALPKQPPVVHSRLVQQPPALAIAPLLREAISRPEETDPLSHLTIDVLWGLADQLQAPIVACLDDELDAVTLEGIRDGQIDYQRLVTVANQRANTRFEMKDGCLAVRPEFATLADLRRIDRRSLGELVRQGFLSGKVSFREFAKFAHRNNSVSARSRLYSSIQRILSYAHIFEHGARYVFPLVQLVGSLTDVQYDRMLKGEEFPYASMNVLQKRRLLGWLNYQDAEWKDPRRDTGRLELMQVGSEVAARLDAASATLALSAEDLPAFQAATSGKAASEAGRYIFGIEQMGTYLALGDGDDAQAASQLSPEGFYQGVLRGLTAKLNFSRELKVDVRFDEDWEMDRSKAVRWADFPKDVQERIRQAAEAARRILNRRSAGGGGLGSSYAHRRYAQKLRLPGLSLS